jgi:hypothetical protein
MEILAAERQQGLWLKKLAKKKKKKIFFFLQKKTI